MAGCSVLHLYKWRVASLQIAGELFAMKSMSKAMLAKREMTHSAQVRT
jgi:hypothetical protein